MEDEMDDLLSIVGTYEDKDYKAEKSQEMLDIEQTLAEADEILKEFNI